MGRVIAWIFEQDFYWFLLYNAEVILAIAVLLWIRGALIHLSEVFADENLPAKD